MDGKFSQESLGKLPGQPAGGRVTIKFHPTEGNPEVVCTMDHWAFDSCGVVSIFGFSRHQGSSRWRDQEFVDRFVEYLKNIKFKFDDWQPREYMFALSNSQLKDYYGNDGNKLAKHPLVKQVDKFKNKAHGPSDIHVFRLSVKKDFNFHENTPNLGA